MWYQVLEENLLKVFWESHDPTQGNRQGNDRGTQYRSSIYFYDDNQSDIINKSKEIFQNEINKFNYGKITTEVKKINDFYYAENYHQQYLIKVPNGYCGLSGCNVNYPINAWLKIPAVVINNLIKDKIMKVSSSLKTLRSRDRNCQIVRRRGRLYVINKKNPRMKARQG